MAGTTRLELATSAVTEFTRRTQRNQSDTPAIVGNNWVHWAQLEGFCSTNCSTAAIISDPSIPASTSRPLRKQLCVPRLHLTGSSSSSRRKEKLSASFISGYSD